MDSLAPTKTDEESGEGGERNFYAHAVEILTAHGIDFMIGGGHAFNAHTKMGRPSKDFDIFIHQEACADALQVMQDAGYETELTFPHWLGKSHSDGRTIDFIFGSGNGVAPVDDDWFTNARAGELWGLPVLFCPVEELIWSKSFIMERERYDGSEIAHLLHSCAEDLDWPRLLARFGEHWPVLLSHLVLFHFIYPFDRHKMPLGVTQLLIRKLRTDLIEPPPERKICNGTLLSRAQYLVDIEDWGSLDGRLEPPGRKKKQEIEDWTNAMREEGILD
ncbi:MAG: nucleotidyltransferase family protein [Acidobacteria bacterium]|nr:nucleotidyltransferase family protein [Acidobacteriota bacterium]